MPIYFHKQLALVFTIGLCVGISKVVTVGKHKLPAGEPNKKPLDFSCNGAKRNATKGRGRFHEAAPLLSSKQVTDCRSVGQRMTAHFICG